MTLLFESFVNSIADDEVFHYHDRRMKIAAGDGVLWCAGCGKEYARWPLADLPLYMGLPPYYEQEGAAVDDITVIEMATIWSLSFISTITLLSIFYYIL